MQGDVMDNQCSCSNFVYNFIFLTDWNWLTKYLEKICCPYDQTLH